MRRRFEYKDMELEDFLIRFYPAGNYTWTVPPGCTEVDVFLVGGGGAGHNGSGGGGGYTKTFKKDTSGWRDGDAISVAEVIQSTSSSALLIRSLIPSYLLENIKTYLWSFI